MELFNTNLGRIFIIIFILINIFSFIMMFRDKHKAINKHHTERTPEGLIFFSAIMFGSIGVYVGMFTLRHKTKKWYFLIGIPLLIIQNLITIYFFWRIIY